MLQITSTYEQDWSYMVNLCEKLNIKYNIERRIRNTGNKHSDFRITRLEDIKIIGDYLYSSFENDNIGFPRKYNKYKEIITKFKKSKFSEKFKNDFLNLVIIEKKSNKEICTILNIKKETCEYLKWYFRKKKIII